MAKKEVQTTEAAQAAPKKKKKTWLILVIVAAVLVLIIAGSSGGSDDTSTSDSSDTGSSQSQSTSDEDKVYVAGETYQDSSIKVTYQWNNANFTDYDSWADVPDGYKVVQACFDFENVGSSDFVASAYDFNCFADNVSCEGFYYTDDSGFTDDLSAGRIAQGKCVYYLVPTNAQSIVLEYEPSIWSSKKVTFQIQ